MDYIQSGSFLNDMSTDFDYDYGAFIQDDDADYLAGESSGSNTLEDGISPTLTAGMLTANTTTSAPPAPTVTAMALMPNRQISVTSAASPSALLPRTRLERRGHTKSRRGCFNCKRRRIKCQETRPACGHCTKTGLKCEYPAMPLVVHQPQHQIPLFSLQDMRFFQHFLLQCYPHYPIGAENIWTHEVPCLSQKYEYLMHAILGFAASELISQDPTLVAPAMDHRLKAIKAIKKTLADVPKAPSNNSFEEGNALMATCFALTFQSVWLSDGMAEYMTFIRGIIIVAMQMYMKGCANFIFGDFLGDKQTETLAPHMQQLPLIKTEWTDAAVAGIKGLEPLLVSDTEKKYHEMILVMAQKLYVSSWEAYQALTAHYGWWMMLPHDQFERLIDPNNQVAILLGSHWIALKQIMATITETERKGAAKQPQDEEQNRHDMDVGIIRWLKFLNRSVDAEHVVYNSWPVWVEAQLDRDLGFFGKTR
ncbi:hypothetical protein B0H66DRAFT_565067 [Apodospora peruviana]|uniref:Zn(2)-C6 fungal-type domain-containing protein n=1 Tax=Apodospora peruviana TaxID=516989 RepID=A0AAE0M1F8_9PEZI|nr:hypothetical protein B0H66DRAFT_565067 [Apodospora peruviana]